MTGSGLGGSPARPGVAWAARALYVVAGLGVCTGILVVLRDLLHRDGFWYDELYYLSLLRLPFAEAMQHIRVDVHPPLYFLLLGAWTPVFGTTDVAVRSLSTLAALGALALLWRRGGGQASRAALALASLWLATNWLWAFCAREARMYDLALLGGCWLALAFSRLWNLGREPAPRELWLFCLGALLVAFVHYSAMALACSALLLLLLRHRRSPRLWLPMAAVVALCVAWAAWHGLHIQEGDWIRIHTFAGKLSGLPAAAYVLWSVFFPGRPYSWPSPPSPALWLVWSGLLCTYGLMAVAWIRRGRLGAGGGVAREDPNRALLRGLLLLLGVFVAAMSAIHEFKPLLVPKAMVVALPSLALCVGCVGAILWSGRIWMLCALAVVLGGISAPIAAYGLDKRWLQLPAYDEETVREIARQLEEDPSGQLRVYCAGQYCEPDLMEAMRRGFGVEVGGPGVPEESVRLYGRDFRHLVPPLLLASTDAAVVETLRGKWGFTARELGAGAGGGPWAFLIVPDAVPDGGAGPR